MRKKHRNPLVKAAKQIEIRGNKHCIYLYSATAMALWRYWGKKEEVTE